MRGVGRAEIEERTKNVLDIVRLDGFAGRYPAQLSGGQKQRVALARSMAVRPAILLFDEPLSALDLSLRLQLRAEIKRLHDELGFSAIYVTHDQGEAMAMSSRVAIMNKGEIVQIDRPQVVFNSPADEFVFNFIGESCCMSIKSDGRKITDENGQPVNMKLAKPPASGSWRIYVRPTRLRIGQSAAGCDNTVTATVSFTEFLGDVWRYHLNAGAVELLCDHAGPDQFEPGDTLPVGWDNANMSVFQ